MKLERPYEKWTKKKKKFAPNETASHGQWQRREIKEKKRSKEKNLNECKIIIDFYERHRHGFIWFQTVYLWFNAFKQISKEKKKFFFSFCVFLALQNYIALFVCFFLHIFFSHFFFSFLHDNMKSTVYSMREKTIFTKLHLWFAQKAVLFKKRHLKIFLFSNYPVDFLVKLFFDHKLTKNLCEKPHFLQCEKNRKNR